MSKLIAENIPQTACIIDTYDFRHNIFENTKYELIYHFNIICILIHSFISGRAHNHQTALQRQQLCATK